MSTISLTTNVWQSSIAKMEKHIYELYDKYSTSVTRKIFGNAQSPLILTNDVKLNTFLMPWSDKKILDKFVIDCEGGCNNSSTQDNYALYIVKASGCGKTKLALSLGLETKHIVVPIRLYVRAASIPVTQFNNSSLLFKASKIGHVL